MKAKTHIDQCKYLCEQIYTHTNTTTSSTSVNVKAASSHGSGSISVTATSSNDGVLDSDGIDYTYSWTYPSNWSVYSQWANFISLYTSANPNYGAYGEYIVQIVSQPKNRKPFVESLKLVVNH